MLFGLQEPIKLNTYKALTLCPQIDAEAYQIYLRDSSRMILKMILLWETVRRVGGKPIALWLQSVLGMNAGNPLIEELDGQCARRAIAEVKQSSQWSVIGWVIKIYDLELLRSTEGTLNWLQSLAPAPVLRKVDVRQAAGCKNYCRVVITTWWKTCCTDFT
jgi:hypothetical protein